MHLKSLRLQGFKTFARRTELPFTQGITAIVGPNGSGKSNLVDAIRWALGERNPRGLRGHRMEDVIYSGGPGRSPVGMAEVSLLLDNSDQRLNVEFSEIEVARRLYRSGESDYLINGARARLRDIDTLLASTGLRQTGYAVTAQNDIDYVIQASPAARRELIEEAAGVRILREQRQEAQNRLGEAERDMARARDLLNELNPRADELRLQAAAAEEYRALTDQLRELQGSLARDAWRKAMVQLRRARGREQSARDRRDEAARAVEEFAPGYAIRRAQLKEAHESRFSQQQAVAELRLRIAESRHQLRIAEERRESIARELGAARQEIERLEEAQRAGVQVLKEVERDASALDAELEERRVAREAAVQAETEQRRRRSTAEETNQALSQRRQELQRERLSAEAELRQLDARLDFLHEQLRQAASQREETMARQAKSQAALETVQEQLEACEQEVNESIARAGDAQAGAEALADELREAEQAIATASAEVQAIEAELGALRLLRDRAHQGSAVAGKSVGVRRLLELLEVAPEHWQAVEAALEGQLDAWVAADAHALGQASALVSASEQRETILHARSLPGGAPGLIELPAGLTGVLSLVRAPQPYQDLLGALIGDAVLCVDREQAFHMATAHPQLRFVTAAGEVVTAWSYRGGRGERAALSVQAQLNSAESRLTELAGRLDQLRRQEAAGRARHAEAVSLRTEAGFKADRARTKRAELAAALISARGSAERDAADLRALEQQQTRLNALFDGATASRSGARQRLERALEAAETLDIEAPRATAEIEASARDLESALAQRQAAELRLALAEQRRQELAAQLERAMQARAGQDEELRRRREAAEALTQEPQQLEADRERTLVEVRQLEGQLSSLETAPLPGADAVAQLEAAVREDEERNVKLQVEMAHTEDALTTAGVEVRAASEEVDRCRAALHDEAHPLEEQDAAEEVDWQKTEREVSRLNKKLESMGAVNLLAPDEYAQIRDRCDNLAGQLSDLEAAVEHLTDLRRQLEASIDERFRTVFQSVAVNFQEFFHELFEGGRATLRLDDEVEDPLDQGVEILAQTPGKRLLQLTLLSGGERALTALAFLFALQAVNPSPFYVLDEVDAALDDANVVRFNRVLKRLALDQQFIVVTHNHSTMAQAAALFGVTLGEHGISRIVSVRLEHGEPHYAAVGERTA